jgi:two-component system CheB/CheR fusion protein
VHGDDLNLRPKQALALSMALHELATNAAKYGALSVPHGQVTVAWTSHLLEQRQRLHLHWTESGGPAVVTPKRRGFGSRLISDGLPYELDGQVALDFPPGGVTCNIDVPLDSENP